MERCYVLPGHFLFDHGSSFSCLAKSTHRGKKTKEEGKGVYRSPSLLMVSFNYHSTLKKSGWSNAKSNKWATSLFSTKIDSRERWNYWRLSEGRILLEIIRLKAVRAGMTPRGSEGWDSDVTSIVYYNLINIVIRRRKGSGNYRYTYSHNIS